RQAGTLPHPGHAAYRFIWAIASQPSQFRNTRGGIAPASPARSQRTATLIVPVTLASSAVWCRLLSADCLVPAEGVARIVTGHPRRRIRLPSSRPGMAGWRRAGEWALVNGRGGCASARRG